MPRDLTLGYLCVTNCFELELDVCSSIELAIISMKSKQNRQLASVLEYQYVDKKSKLVQKFELKILQVNVKNK